jgi:hypothetical protein
MQVDVSSASGDYVVATTFARGDERLALDQVRLVLGSGFLLTDAAIARLAFGGIREALLIRALPGGQPVRIPGTDAPALAESLARVGVPAGSLPEELRLAEIDVEPKPRVRLAEATRYGINPRLEAALSFDYDGTVLDDAGPPIHADVERRRMIRRRLDDERKAAAHLLSVGFRQSFEHGQARPTLWLVPAQLPEAARALIDAGWHVEAEGRSWRAPGQVRMSVTSGIDWFDLEATVDFGGQTLALPEALAALARGRRAVQLGDGSIGMLPHEWL